MSRPTASSLLSKFPFGTAPLVVLLVTLLAGSWVLAHPSPAKNPATIRLWTYTPEHIKQYQAAAAAYERANPGVHISVEQFEYRAMATRLRSAFWAGLDVPELVETNSTLAAGFFAGPVDEVGFLDLRPLLESSGLIDHIVKSRLAQFTNRGHIFGLPHDVHPVLIAYRKDIFDAEGIDVSTIETWDDFVRVGRRLRRLPGEHPDGARYILQLPRAEGWGVEIMMIQNGGGYFDADGQLIMDSEETVQAIERYVPMIAGPDRVAGDLGNWAQPMVKAMEEGRTLSFLAPDWRARGFENDMPLLKGKMALMPLPAFKRGGRRTSTWGGSMLGLTKLSKDPERVWDVARYLYTSPESCAAEWNGAGILPPVRDAWKLPAFNQRSAYWSNQLAAQEYAKVADDVPAHYMHPLMEFAEGKLGEVEAAAVRYYEEHGADGFDAFVRRELHGAADVIRRQMRRNPF
ncbi:MAG TPA: extracellular solute-binding protein [Polyangiaceae bacterium]